MFLGRTLVVGAHTVAALGFSVQGQLQCDRKTQSHLKTSCFELFCCQNEKKDKNWKYINAYNPSGLLVQCVVTMRIRAPKIQPCWSIKSKILAQSGELDSLTWLGMSMLLLGKRTQFLHILLTKSSRKIIISWVQYWILSGKQQWN